MENNLNECLEHDTSNSYEFTSKFPNFSQFCNVEFDNMHSFFELCLKRGLPFHYSNTRVPPQLRPALIAKDLLWFAKIGVNELYDLIKSFGSGVKTAHLCKMNTRSVRRMHLWTIIYPLYLFYKFPNIRIKINVANHHTIPEYSNWVLADNVEFQNKFFKFEVEGKNPDSDDQSWWRDLTREGSEGIISYSSDEDLFSFEEDNFDILIIDDTGLIESTFLPYIAKPSLMSGIFNILKNLNEPVQNNIQTKVSSVKTNIAHNNIIIEDDTDFITNFSNIESQNTMPHARRIVDDLQTKSIKDFFSHINDSLLNGFNPNCSRLKQLLVFYDTKRTRPQLFLESDELKRFGFKTRYSTRHLEETELVVATFGNDHIHYELHATEGSTNDKIDNILIKLCSIQRHDVDLQFTNAHWHRSWYSDREEANLQEQKHIKKMQRQARSQARAEEAEQLEHKKRKQQRKEQKLQKQAKKELQMQEKLQKEKEVEVEELLMKLKKRREEGSQQLKQEVEPQKLQKNEEDKSHDEMGAYFLKDSD